MIKKYMHAIANLADIGRLIGELSHLINSGKVVVLRPHFQMNKSVAVPREIVRDVVHDFLNVYGTVSLSKKASTGITIPPGAILLLYPLALLKIPPTHDEYLKLIGNKTRNMIRKAGIRGYEYREFDWNDHLDDIFEINVSNTVRFPEALRGWYRDPVQPRYPAAEEQCYRKYYGVFKNEKLYAYLHIIICGDFAFFRHFFGHAQHLTNGIMNGLVSWVVGKYVGHPQVRWLKYGTLTNKWHSMFSFRKHTGFEGYATFLDLEDNQELLELARKKRIKYWRSV